MNKLLNKIKTDLKRIDEATSDINFLVVAGEVRDDFETLYNEIDTIKNDLLLLNTLLTKITNINDEVYQMRDYEAYCKEFEHYKDKKLTEQEWKEIKGRLI